MGKCNRIEKGGKKVKWKMSFQSSQESQGSNRCFGSIKRHDSDGKNTSENDIPDVVFPLVVFSSAVYRSLTFKRSVQQGIAAKMSNEYIVPIKSADPSHLSAQKL
jgi:hypothetical protein